VVSAIAERGPQGLGKGDRQPVEGFDFRRIDRFHRYRAERPVPRAEHGKHAEKQNQRAAGIADSQGPIGKIGHRRAGRRGGDDRRPVKKGVKLLGRDLQDHQHHEQ
jgi:hypothetical protein